MPELDNIRQECNPYNKEPVHYCKHCYSLAIRILDDNNDYCDKCGNTSIEVIDIKSWESLYRSKYGENFLKIK